MGVCTSKEKQRATIFYEGVYRKAEKQRATIFYEGVYRKAGDTIKEKNLYVKGDRRGSNISHTLNVYSKNQERHKTFIKSKDHRGSFDDVSLMTLKSNDSGFSKGDKSAEDSVKQSKAAQLELTEENSRMSQTSDYFSSCEDINTLREKLKYFNENEDFDSNVTDFTNKIGGLTAALNCTGVHEVEIMERKDKDASMKEFLECKKHPGHEKFLSIKSFSINDLPEKCEHIYNLIRICADLTVRIAVSYTSHQRPMFWPGNQGAYPYSDGVSLGTRFGSGRVEEVKKINSKYETCPCRKCKQSDSPNTLWGLIRICTATHVVFDDIEAASTKCLLFYDNEDTAGTCIDGIRLETVDVKKDSCKLLCATCEREVVNRLDRLVDDFIETWENSFDKYFENANPGVEKMAVIVSHPHGYYKHVSIGQWTKRHEDTSGDVNYHWYTYDTPTCPGSDGAYVLVPNFNDVY